MNLKDENEPRKGLNVVIQKEYLIITSDNPHPVLATDSVQGCYAILLFHPAKSGILHWDDNNCRTELNVFVNEFLSPNIQLKDCTVHLIGGWKDNNESVRNGEFLKNYFLKSEGKLVLDFYQKKRSTGSLDEQRFSFVSLDSRNGEVSVQDTQKGGLKLNDEMDTGENVGQRLENHHYLDKIHCQNDQYPDSGTRIISRNGFFQRHAQEINTLCAAARDNKIEAIVQCIDHGVTDINASPKNAKGWTPLHYACKMGHMEAAQLLIKHGANLDQKNDAGKTPYDLMDSQADFNKKQLKTLHRCIQFQVSIDPISLRATSLFARHPEQLDSGAKQQLALINALLNSEDGLNSIMCMLPSQ